ncbi:hypothetical protein C8Q75DRAFT_754886 [Abortiporus biennis]|nr:hypothetical protein C8Q75DRAFT_754886 [Abortiporus biennis]
MSEDIITKRLHVSGLTPAITVADLSQKLGSFGSIKALDGFGKFDALGEPRKFGYVTLETTKGKLARCMNLLSGVTWKGTKFRIGEAKPDFRERIAAENTAAEEGPPQKKRRLVRGVHGVQKDNMTLVTPENVKEHSGWRVTELGRLIKPIRMRPDHPLPQPVATSSKASTKTTKGKPKKKRVRDPPTRARRKTIDPTKYGSQHLKGIFLDTDIVADTVSVKKPFVEEENSGPVSESSSSESSDDEVMADDEATSQKSLTPVAAEASLHKPSLPVSPPPTTVARASASKPSLGLPDTELEQEKKTSLGLLHSMFGDDDWGGQETDLSDVEMADLTAASSARKITGTHTDPGFEEVPLDVSDIPVISSKELPEKSQEEEVEADDESAVVEDELPAQRSDSGSEHNKPVQKTKLKDLFAPKDAEGGFSLLGHLDLDLELEEDVLGLGIAQTHTESSNNITDNFTVTTQKYSESHPRRHPQVTLDSRAPLFFPVSGDDRKRARDPFTVLNDKGWNWKSFSRNETSEEIKKRWEDTKGDLTRDWKKRHREAVKSRRRRGGHDGGD